MTLANMIQIDTVEVHYFGPSLFFFFFLHEHHVNKPHQNVGCQGYVLLSAQLLKLTSCQISEMGMKLPRTSDLWPIKKYIVHISVKSGETCCVDVDEKYFSTNPCNYEIDVFYLGHKIKGWLISQQNLADIVKLNDTIEKMIAQQGDA